MGRGARTERQERGYWGRCDPAWSRRPEAHSPVAGRGPSPIAGERARVRALMRGDVGERSGSPVRTRGSRQLCVGVRVWLLQSGSAAVAACQRVCDSSLCEWRADREATALHAAPPAEGRAE